MNIVKNSANLPRSWINTPLSDVINIRNGFAFKKKDYKSSGILLIRQTNLGRNRVAIKNAVYLPVTYLSCYQGFVVQKGDILIGMSGSIGKTCIYNLEMVALQNQRTGLLQFYEPDMREYIRYYTQTLDNELSEMAKGVAVQNISASQILSCSVPLPPIYEQKRIVAKLEELFSELDKGVEALKTAQEQLKVYRQAVLKWAFEGKLTEGWRKQQKTLPSASQLMEKIKAERGKQAKLVAPLAEAELSKLPMLPEQWCWAKMEHVGGLGRGKSKHRPRNDKKLFGGPYPFVQTGEIRAVREVVKSYDNTYSEFGLSQSKLWPKGTLCITIAANIAETAFLGFDSCFPDSIVGFTTDTKLALSKFVFYFFKGNQKRIEEFAPATAQKNINLNILENLNIPYCSLNEQQTIVQEIETRLSVADKLEETIAQSLQQAEALRQSILKKAFAGQLVPQDPNDEPASKLLERIKAEKAIQAPVKGADRGRGKKALSSPSALVGDP